MRWAMYTARIPNTRLTPMYVSATPEAPFIIKSWFSSAKEENVVKPPQIPTFKKKHRPRIQGLPGRQRHHHTDEERSRNINDKCFYWKTAFRVHIQKSHEISEHRPHETAGAHYQAFNH